MLCCLELEEKINNQFYQVERCFCHVFVNAKILVNPEEIKTTNKDNLILLKQTHSQAFNFSSSTLFKLLKAILGIDFCLKFDKLIYVH